ncbi:hypothetical protein [Mariniphaga sp.]
MGFFCTVASPRGFLRKDASSASSRPDRGRLFKPNGNALGRMDDLEAKSP